MKKIIRIIVFTTLITAMIVPLSLFTKAYGKEKNMSEHTIETIVLAGGCFWGVEAVFEHTKGVIRVISGYAGGSAQTAQYQAVSRGDTNHAEAVEVSYDPQKISLVQLLDIYFKVAHDPTQLNFQGPDHGTQYRSTIFFATKVQRETAQNKIRELNDQRFFSQPIVTTLEKLEHFYPAEGYHQDFAARNPNNPYIIIHDAPKVKRLKKIYPELYREIKAL